MSKRLTPCINLYAGPGAGKSTVAAGVFYELKLAGVNCELVREYAKERVWLGDFYTLKNQLYVSGKQLHRQTMLRNKVDVIITDSPIILGAYYSGKEGSKLEAALVEAYDELFDNTNYFLNRNTDKHPYVKKGRRQTKKQAEKIDRGLRKLLDRNKLPYTSLEFNGDDTVHSIVHKYFKKYGKPRKL